MATLQQVRSRGDLHGFDPDLEADELPQRYLYVTTDCRRWIEDVLTSAPRDLDKTLPPINQLDSLATQFVRGVRFVYGRDFKALDFLGYCVWELRTYDVRLFGYFYRRGIFIGVGGVLKKELANNKAYLAYRKQVRDFMQRIDLDPPPALKGSAPSDVL
jgi:hypothetical protein